MEEVKEGNWKRDEKNKNVLSAFYGARYCVLLSIYYPVHSTILAGGYESHCTEEQIEAQER